MRNPFAKISFILVAVLFSAVFAEAQNFKRDLNLTKGASIEIVNNFGRVDVLAEKPETEEPTEIKSFLTAKSGKSIAESEIKISNANNKVLVEVVPSDTKTRIDLSFHLPERTNLKIQTNEGEVRVSGDFEEVEVRTETGTIAADVPLD